MTEIKRKKIHGLSKYSLQQARLELKKFIHSLARIQELFDICVAKAKNKGKNAFEKCMEIHNITDTSPPKNALLNIKSVRKIVDGSISHLWVVEPQLYSYISRLNTKHMMLDTVGNEGIGLFYAHPYGNRKGLALSGTGGDEWWLVSDKLIDYIKREQSRIKGAIRVIEKKSQS